MMKSPYFPYMAADGGPVIQFRSMIPPNELIVRGNAWLPMQAIVVWTDEHHAEIALGYGCNTMHVETVHAIQAMNRNPHLIKLFVVVGQVFGLQRYKVKQQMGWTGEHFKVEEGLEVNIKVLGRTAKKPKFSKCFVVDKYSGFKEADLVLLVLDKNKSYFPNDMVATWPADQDNVDEFDVEVEAEISTKVVRSQWDALSRIYDPCHHQGNKGKYLRLLYWHSDANFPVSDPYLDAHNEKERDIAETT